MESACKLGSTELVGALLGAGAPASHSEAPRATPAHIAARCLPFKTGEDILKLLLDKVSQDDALRLQLVDALCDEEERRSLTPLHYAAETGNGGAVRLLLEAGADPGAVALSTKLQIPRTPAQLAMKSGFSDLAEVLSRAPARPARQSAAPSGGMGRGGGMRGGGSSSDGGNSPLTAAREAAETAARAASSKTSIYAQPHDAKGLKPGPPAANASTGPSTEPTSGQPKAQQPLGGAGDPSISSATATTSSSSSTSSSTSTSPATAPPAPLPSDLNDLLKYLDPLPWADTAPALFSPTCLEVCVTKSALPSAPAPPAPPAPPLSKRLALSYILRCKPPRELAARALSLLARSLPPGEPVDPAIPHCLTLPTSNPSPFDLILHALRLDDEDDLQGMLFLSQCVEPSIALALPGGGTITQADIFLEYFVERFMGKGHRSWRLRDDGLLYQAAGAPQPPPKPPAPTIATTAATTAATAATAGTAKDIAGLVSAGRLPPDYLDIVKEFQAKADEAARGAWGKCSLLHYAAKNWGPRAETAMLAHLSSGGDLAPEDAEGDTPLHTAARAGALKAVELLIEWGAPWHLINKRQPRGETFVDAAFASAPGQGADATRAWVKARLGRLRVGDPKLPPEHEWTKLRYEARWKGGELNFPSLDGKFDAKGQREEGIMTLVGIAGVKAAALGLVKALLLDEKREVHSRVCLEDVYNFVFVGNPGTGKTTVAELMGKMLEELEVRKPAPATATPAPGTPAPASGGAAAAAQPAPPPSPTTKPFVAEFGYKLKQEGSVKFNAMVDPTAPTRVLFIDEVYQLDPAGSAEGAAITNTLLDVTETRRKELSVFVAGYKEDVQGWLGYNSGLPSRFRAPITFEDFTEAQLRATFIKRVRAKGWELAPIPSARAGITTAVIAARRLAAGGGRKGFANARTVRSFVDAALRRANERIGAASPPLVTQRDLCTLTPADVLGEPIDPSTSPAIRELEGMLGLAAVKTAVRGFVQLVRDNAAAELLGEPTSDVPLHRLFLGNPGTGKTETAKLYGRVLRELGMLSSGELELKNASQLEGAHEGATKDIVNRLFDGIKGKVLLIDEAYQLATSKYGQDALDVIVERVQGTPGEDFAVVMCGYTDKMDAMLRTCNSGLASRFKRDAAFMFEDYDEGDLARIMCIMAPKLGLSVRPEVAEAAVKNVLSKQRMRPNFGNGREVKNLLLKASAKLRDDVAQGKEGAAIRRSEEDRCIVLSEGDFFKPVVQGAALEALAEMRSNKGVWDYVSDLMEQVNLQRQRAEESTPGDPVEFNAAQFFHHYTFVGEPGTGKSTGARAFGQVYYGLGLLGSPDNFVERKAIDLIGPTQNSSAPLVNAAMDEALGGVLLIDEAGAMAQKDARLSVGAGEAVNALLANITHPRYKNKLLIILTDYRHNIDKLFGMNEGLRSRFSRMIEFSSSSPCACVDLVVRVRNCALPNGLHSFSQAPL